MIVASVSKDGIVRCVSVLTLAVNLMPGIGQAQETLTASFEIREATVSLHEPIYMDFFIRNGLKEEVQFDLGFNRVRNFALSIIQPDGSILELPKIREAGMSRSGEVLVRPGGTYTQRLLLNQWHDFRELGNYIVRARLDAPVRTRLGVPVQFELSESIALQITPRDLNRLDAVCRSLAETAVGKLDAEKAIEAAEALSHIQDEVAVRHLTRVLREGEFTKLIAVRGLGRIRNTQALAVLRANLKTEDPGPKAAIEIALRGIEVYVTD